MAVTSIAFLIGAVAICGIPPLNGFISEFLIYSGAFKGVISKQFPLLAGSILIIGSLALIGGLALACFTKVYGIVFLGESRSSRVTDAHEVSRAMKLPMLFLAAACVAVGLFAPLIVKSLRYCIAEITGLDALTVGEQLVPFSSILFKISLVAICLSGLTVLLVILRKRILSSRVVKTDVTWDCGYARPAPRMQYTASSFAQPLVDTFKLILRTKKKLKGLRGFFPQNGQFESHTPEFSREYMFQPLFKFVGSTFEKLKWLQHGNVQLYILYIALTLIILMILEA